MGGSCITTVLWGPLNSVQDDMNTDKSAIPATFVMLIEHITLLFVVPGTVIFY